jgi:ADP-ribose pyrophosphatase
MEKLKNTRSFFNTGTLCAYLDEIITASGRVKERLRIDHPEAAAVIPLLKGGKVVMVRQYRYAADRWTLELPAGKVDPGEEPDECARRELFEETGYRADKLEKVLEFHPAAAYSNELLHLFVATSLKEPSSIKISEEIAGVHVLGVGEALDLVMKGEITDAKTVIGLMWERLFRE